MDYDASAPCIRQVSIAEIALETGPDWTSVKQYLADGAPVVPPAGTQPRVITLFIGLIDSWLRADITIKGTVIYERLVADRGFTANYQRVKQYCVEARPRIAEQLADDDGNPLRGCTGASR